MKGGSDKLNNTEKKRSNREINRRHKKEAEEKLSLNCLTISPSQWPKRHFFEQRVKCIQTNHCHH